VSLFQSFAERNAKHSTEKVPIGRSLFGLKSLSEPIDWWKIYELSEFRKEIAMISSKIIARI